MFSANDVKTLRERTGAGMLDCKKALDATSGDLEKAIDWLREKGIAKALKKESRIAAEGTTYIVTNDHKAVMIEVNSETDFVAQNETFQEAVKQIAEAILNSDATTMEEAKNIAIDGETLEQLIINLTAKIGEKISFRRMICVPKEENQVFGVYSHMNGKIGVITLLEGKNEMVAKDVAMHVAAMNPMALDRDSMDEKTVEHEKEVIKEQVMNEGKPEEIAVKMVNGRINKFYKENCLLEQEFIKDSSMNVEDYAKANQAKVLSFVRFEVGEGIEKKEEDFASEVQSQING